MYTKRQRIFTWIVLAGISILIGCGIEILAEVYFPNSWFHTIASFTFASGAVLGISGITLSFLSLAWNDWQEGKNTQTFVNIGENDRIISVHKIEDAVIHLPVAGTTHQTILAPKAVDIPRIINGPVEHIHVANMLPKVEIMDDGLYQKLFGNGVDRKE